jgi:hypothetical protein
MQDVQNVPNPDVNSTERDDDFGNHSDVYSDNQKSDVEKPKGDMPSDYARSPSIEEPPAEDGFEEPNQIA